jgi:hypothetical protein
MEEYLLEEEFDVEESQPFFVKDDEDSPYCFVSDSELEDFCFDI